MTVSIASRRRLQRAHRRRQAGIVEQQVDLAPGRGKPGKAIDRFAVAHVDLERKESIAKLVGKFAQPVGTAAGPDNSPAAIGEAPRGGSAESGGCAA